MVFSGNARKIATVLTAKDQASGEIKSVESAGDDAAESMEGAEDSAVGLGKAFGVAAAATGALVGALGMLTRQHGETEQRFARLQTVAGATDEEMNKLRGTAATLGRELPIAMSDAADAMENLAFAGFSAQESMAAAQGVANLSVASNMNMAQSARAAASSLRAFNMEAEEMSRVTGTMAAVVATSNTRFSELNSALQRVSASASMLGVSIEETSAALGVMADMGIRASMAGTALNAMFSRLASRSGNAQEALDRLGVSMEELTDESGELEDLDVVLSKLAGGMENIESRADQMRVATQLAGRRGARAILPLLDNQEELNEKMGEVFRSQIQESIGALSQLDAEQLEGAEEALDMELSGDTIPREIVQRMQQLHEEGESVDEIAARMEAGLNISGDAAQAFAEDLADGGTSAEELAAGIGDARTASSIAASQMDTTAGAVEFMKSSFDAMTFAIFTGVGPAIEWFNMALAKGINLLNQNKAVMGAVGAALGALTAALGLVTLALGAAWVQASLAPAVMGVLSGSFLASAASASTLTGALGALYAALAPIAAPALAVVAAIAGLVALFFALKKVIENDILGVGSDLEVLMSRMGAVIDAIAPPLKQVGSILMNVGKIILGIALAPFIAQFIALIKALKILSDVIVWTIDNVMALINGTKSLGEVMGEAADLVVGFFTDIGSKVIGAITSIDWAGLAHTVISTLVTGLISAIALYFTAWGMYLNFLKKFWLDIVPGFLMDAGEFIIGALVDGILAAPGLIVDAMMWYGEFIIRFWTEIVPGFLMDAGKFLIGAIADGIAAVPGVLTDALVETLASLIPFLPGSDADKGPLSSLTQAGMDLVGAIADGILGAPGAILGALSSILGGIPGAIAGAALDIGKKIAGGIADGISGAADAVGGAVDSLVGGAADVAGGALNKAKDAGKAVADTVSDGVDGAKDTVKDAASGVADTIGGALPGSDADYGPLSNLTQVGPDFVQTIAGGMQQEQGTLKGAASGVMGSVGGALESTPLGQPAGKATDALGISLPGMGGGGDGGSGKPPGAAGGGPQIEVTQEFTFEGDVEDPEEVREAAESGTTDALSELERKLQADLSDN